MVDVRRLRRAVNGARTFTVPVDAVATALAEIDRAMQSARFRAATPATASGATRTYRRGSALGSEGAVFRRSRPAWGPSPRRVSSSCGSASTFREPRA